MKKILFAVMAIAVIAFAGCNKEDKVPDSLVGTTWKFTEAGFTATLQFTSSTEFTAAYVDTADDEDSWSGSGTYTYNPPKVVMTIDGESVTATVSDKKMTTVEGIDEGEPRTYTKQ